MRNLNECQAEIFRRSKKRIEVRNQRRKHILLTCIPVALFISILGALVLPGRGFMHSEDNREEGKTQYAGESTAFAEQSIMNSIQQIEVTWGGDSLSYTNESLVRLISNKLYGLSFSYGNIMPEGSTQLNDGNSEGGDSSTEFFTDSSVTIYTITLITDNGSNIEYWLAGDRLLYKNANRVIILSREQVDELFDLLGL